MRLFLIPVFLISTLGFSFAQGSKSGDLNLTLGAGASAVGLLFNSINYQQLSTTPVLNGMIDYSVANVFSVGVAGSFQSFKGSDIDGSGNNFTDRISCLNLGVRPLFHIPTPSADALDLYAGARFGYVIWQYTSDNPTSDPLSAITPSAVSIQPLFGATYYFINAVGINMELAPIGTYLAHIGIKFRIGT